jgi:nitrite reductase/ring-hydroxylating ferredoxin subunit
MTEPCWFVIDDVNPDEVEFPVAARVDGEDIIIFRVGGRLRGIQRSCPHEDADLLAGKLIGDMIKCPHHGFIFRLSDGKGMNCPGLAVHAKAFEVSIEGSRLRVRKITG